MPVFPHQRKTVETGRKTALAKYKQRRAHGVCRGANVPHSASTEFYLNAEVCLVNGFFVSVCRTKGKPWRRDVKQRSRSTNKGERMEFAGGKRPSLGKRRILFQG